MPRRTPIPDAPPDPLQRWRDRDATPSLFSDLSDPSDLSPSSSAISAASVVNSGSSSKSSRHSATLAREQDRSHAKTGKASPGNRSGREIVIDDLKDALWTYLTRMGIGHEFHAVDFLNWLDARPETSRWKVPPGFDLRCLGGLWARLLGAGTIARIGYGPNGGRVSADSTYSSTTRPVYRIVALDMSATGWNSATGEPPPRDRSAA